jgi:uncharacterized paraquat-inducible protein A
LTKSTAPSVQTRTDAGLPVGPFFLIVALSVSIAAFLLLRGQSLAALVLLAITLVAAGLTAAAVYRTVAPLGVDFDEPPLVAGRTRAALERDKALSLRAIKELEFDHAMGKVSDADFVEMRDRLRARAVRLMSQLEGSALYRDRIEQDAAQAETETSRTCGACGTSNDADARFCKGCGAPVRKS